MEGEHAEKAEEQPGLPDRALQVLMWFSPFSHRPVVLRIA